LVSVGLEENYCPVGILFRSSMQAGSFAGAAFSADFDGLMIAIVPY
jgi:hypothetical protein